MIAHITSRALPVADHSALCGNVATAGLALLAQHYQQIEWIRLGDAEHRENRMGLPAMVRLVIEEMGEYFPTTLPLMRAIESSIVPTFLEGGFLQSLYEPDDSPVLFHSRSVQRRQIIEQDRIEFLRMVAHSG
jgi:hypothetical protein